MDHYEMVEKLRQKANVSYEDARAALEATNWDILDALIMLENQGKVKDSQRGKEYSTHQSQEGGWKAYASSDFKKTMKRIWRFLCAVVRKGNANTFAISNKKHEELIAMPVTALVLLIIGFWPCSLIALVAGLFFGGRYAFRGPDLGRRVNDAMNRAADMAQGMDEKDK